MNNRLTEIDTVPDWARESSSEGGSKGNGVTTGDVDIEMGNPNSISSAASAKMQPVERETISQNKHMQHFFEDVDLIKSDIACIRNATKQIEKIDEEAMMATTSDMEKELSQKLTPLVMDTNKKAKNAKTMLSQLKEENEKMKKEGKCKPSELRIRGNLCSTLTRKFIDEMKNYQKAQQTYKTDIKEKVSRQVQIVKPDATQEEIETVLKSENGRDQLYKEKILTGVADPIKNAYANVADKYQDVLTLEASVAELHQMFLDFALLTEQQGEMLDQIEYQVKSAGDYIDDGNIDIQSAIKYQRSIRKKQCCIIIIVLAILVILLLVSGVFS